MTTKAKQRALGRRQACVLRSLRQHGHWHAACGWIWDTHSETITVLDSLVRRGLAEVAEEFGRDVYYPLKGCEACGEPIYRGNVCRGCWDESHD